jgi:hypothetical protein
MTGDIGKVHCVIVTDWVADEVERQFINDFLKSEVAYGDICEVMAAKLILLRYPQAPNRWADWARDKCIAESERLARNAPGIGQLEPQESEQAETTKQKEKAGEDV